MSYPVNLTVEYPDKLSRGKLLLKVFLGIFYVGIPHGIVLALYEIGVVCVNFVAFWAILFTGKYPRGMHDFVAGFFKRAVKVGTYMMLLHDEYPPFNND